MPDKSVDFILTDPPYMLNLRGAGRNRITLAAQKVAQKISAFAQGFDIDATFVEFERVCRRVNICIFCSNKQISSIMSWWENKGYMVTLLVWDKPCPLPCCNHKYVENLEFIVYVRSKGSTFNNLGYKMHFKTFHYPSMKSKNRLHHTEKPQDLLRHLIRMHTKEGDTVLDPFGGSFSTAMACRSENRKFVGCELCPDFFSKAVERLKHEKTLF